MGGSHSPVPGRMAGGWRGRLWRKPRGVSFQARRNGGPELRGSSFCLRPARSPQDGRGFLRRAAGVKGTRATCPFTCHVSRILTLLSIGSHLCEMGQRRQPPGSTRGPEKSRGAQPRVSWRYRLKARLFTIRGPRGRAGPSPTPAFHK